MPKAIARDSPCDRPNSTYREQARSYNFAVSSSEAPSEQLITNVVDFRSVI